jgi:hypothetical protein
LKDLDLEQYLCSLADVLIELLVICGRLSIFFLSSMVTASGGEWDLKLGQNIVFISELRPWHLSLVPPKPSI